MKKIIRGKIKIKERNKYFYPDFTRKELEKTHTFVYDSLYLDSPWTIPGQGMGNKWRFRPEDIEIEEQLLLDL